MKGDYMAMDNFGNTYHGLGQHPRKELIERIGSGHVRKMYSDKKDGGSVHVGYVIGQHWLTLYEVKPFERSGL